MISMALLVFCVSAVLVWSITFGYWGVLYLLAHGPKRSGSISFEDTPFLTVIVPILNEDQFIIQKLHDLQRTRYASNRLRILIVDGGSSDRSIEYINQFEAKTWPVETMHVNSARGKADQVNVALKNIDTEFAVLSDADTTLEPDCIFRLVTELMTDPGLAMIGAHVVPVTELAEEKLHWKIVNDLWYLEGEAFGAAAVSGVCHAMKLPLLGVNRSVNFSAEDIELTMLATQNGYQVRTHPEAIAYEHRAPNSIGEMLEFRFRRAGDYKKVLTSPSSSRKEHGLTKAMRSIRRWQITAFPVLSLTMLLSSVVLSVFGMWTTVGFFLCMFVVSVLLWLRFFVKVQPDWLLIRTFFRWFTIILASLFGLLRPQQPSDPINSTKEPIGMSYIK